jgi:DNA-binding transcriptional ArsR family regulator
VANSKSAPLKNHKGCGTPPYFFVFDLITEELIESLTHPPVTQHLAVLEAAELVVIGWRGREKIHYLNPGPIYEIFDRWAKKYDRHRIEHLVQLKKVIEENREWPMAKRPQWREWPAPES